MEAAFDIFEVTDATENGEIELVGRTCIDIARGDILCTASMAKFTVLKIYSFMHDWSSISAGMDCALTVQDTYEDIVPLPSVQELQGQMLYSMV